MSQDGKLQPKPGPPAAPRRTPRVPIAFLELPLPHAGHPSEPALIAVDRIESVTPATYHEFSSAKDGARVRTKSGAEHVTTKTPKQVRDLIERAAERLSP